MVGRGGYLNSANVHPWRHLQAAIFAVERMAVKVLRKRCGYGSYILDIGEVPFPGTISGTGGSPGKSESDNPYHKRRAGLEAPACLVECFGELTGGMAVLRASINIANNHYPELMSRVVVLGSNWLFSAAFNIFSLWMHKRSRAKFVFVRQVEQLREWYDESELPEEYGGFAGGWRLNGDEFIAKAIESYDIDPVVASASPWPHEFAGWDEAGRSLAAQDAVSRRRGAVSTNVMDDVCIASANRSASPHTPTTARRRATVLGAANAVLSGEPFGGSVGGSSEPASTSIGIASRSQHHRRLSTWLGDCIPCLGHRRDIARRIDDNRQVTGSCNAGARQDVQQDICIISKSLRLCEDSVETRSDGADIRAGHQHRASLALGLIFLLVCWWMLGSAVRLV